MKPNPTIDIYIVNNKKVVNSFDFYKATGLKRCNYTRWIANIVLEIGTPDKDFSPMPDNIADRFFKRGKYDKFRYYFDIDFAIGLCLVAKRKGEALRLRQFLIDNK
jgi:phage anti-repressor protein